jgi:NAD(P)-dependent dehydrogenase (short-subunit alcohol dehydrogenase family)
MGMLDDKVGVITGAAQGLGRATALLAAREGSRLIVADIQEGKGEETAELVRSAGGEARFVRTDVTEAEQVEAMVATAVETWGRIDWACNNAVGGSSRFGPLHEISDEVWSGTLDVCLKGVFYCMKHEIRAMLEAGSISNGSIVNGSIVNGSIVNGSIVNGSIVNIVTASIFKGEPMLGAYVAAKGGVDTLTKTGAAEYAARGIRVNSVAPGGFQTPAIEGYFRQFPEIEERTVATHAMRRLGRPEEIAEPVVWLASDRASFVTGACLTCDGGILVNSHML